MCIVTPNQGRSFRSHGPIVIDSMFTCSCCTCNCYVLPHNNSTCRAAAPWKKSPRASLSLEPSNSTAPGPSFDLPELRRPPSPEPQFSVTTNKFTQKRKFVTELVISCACETAGVSRTSYIDLRFQGPTAPKFRRAPPCQRTYEEYRSCHDASHLTINLFEFSGLSELTTTC